MRPRRTGAAPRRSVRLRPGAGLLRRVTEGEFRRSRPSGLFLIFPSVRCSRWAVIKATPRLWWSGWFESSPTLRRGDQMRRALSGGSDAAYVYACGITKSGFMPGARSSLSAMPAPLRPDEHVAATPSPAAATPTHTTAATTTATATPTATPTFATTPTPSRSGHAWAPRSKVAVGRQRRVDDDDGRRRGPWVGVMADPGCALGAPGRCDRGRRNRRRFPRRTRAAESGGAGRAFFKLAATIFATELGITARHRAGQRWLSVRMFCSKNQTN
jgi:hypothetical protein